MLLELMLLVYAFSLPLDLFRVRLPFWPARPRRLLAPPRPGRRRAPLAEHAWEEHVLYNLTASE
tara:strand:+ start:65 stop:256 length:192 start_codon:yes stop_codon:yes gene_type:complete